MHGASGFVDAVRDAIYSEPQPHRTWTEARVTATIPGVVTLERARIALEAMEREGVLVRRAGLNDQPQWAPTRPLPAKRMSAAEQNAYYQASLQRCIDADLLLGEYGEYLRSLLRQEMERGGAVEPFDYQGCTYRGPELAAYALEGLAEWLDNDPRKRL
jgi:hypothetical protein